MLGIHLLHTAAGAHVQMCEKKNCYLKHEQRGVNCLCFLSRLHARFWQGLASASKGIRGKKIIFAGFNVMQPCSQPYFSLYGTSVCKYCNTSASQRTKTGNGQLPFYHLLRLTKQRGKKRKKKKPRNVTVATLSPYASRQHQIDYFYLNDC